MELLYVKLTSKKINFVEKQLLWTKSQQLSTTICPINSPFWIACIESALGKVHWYLLGVRLKTFIAVWLEPLKAQLSIAFGPANGLRANCLHKQNVIFLLTVQAS